LKLPQLFSQKTTRKVTGDDAEALAEKHLLQSGLTLVTRNYRCRFGEIDLIMREGDALVFVEVRFRASNDFGGAIESIHVAKQRRLIATAEHYLSGLKQTPPCRFDAILVNKMDHSHVEWIRNAFTA
jgi:putative endonuclease